MKRGSTSRAKATKRSKNGAVGSQHGNRRGRSCAKVSIPEQLAMDPGRDPEELGPGRAGLVSGRAERTNLQRDCILDEMADRNQLKLQSALTAERVEGISAKKLLVEHSTNLLIVEDELAAEEQKHAVQQKIIDKHVKDLAESQEKLAADTENHRSMEKRIAEKESELQKLEFNLRTAKTRASCFSCDAPRNALCVPCLHMFYCMKCQASLEERKCRFCETAIVGVLECFH